MSQTDQRARSIAAQTPMTGMSGVGDARRVRGRTRCRPRRPGPPLPGVQGAHLVGQRPPGVLGADHARAPVTGDGRRPARRRHPRRASRRPPDRWRTAMPPRRHRDSGRGGGPGEAPPRPHQRVALDAGGGESEDLAAVVTFMGRTVGPAAARPAVPSRAARSGDRRAGRVGPGMMARLHHRGIVLVGRHRPGRRDRRRALVRRLGDAPRAAREAPPPRP